MDIIPIGKDDLDYTSRAASNETISRYIRHRECEMLLQNMADVGHPKEDIKDNEGKLITEGIKTIGAKYGFAIDDSAWANAKSYIVQRIDPKIKEPKKSQPVKLEALKGKWDENK